MILILGLVILVAALVVAVAGVLGNGGSAHALGHGFSVLGYHVTGSTGMLFLCGIVVGAVGLFGLSLLVAGARRTSRRGSAARRRLQQSRRETAAVSQDRDDLIKQRDIARADTASPNGHGTPGGDPTFSPDHNRPSWHLFGHRAAPSQAATAHPELLNGQPAPEALAGSPPAAE